MKLAHTIVMLNSHLVLFKFLSYSRFHFSSGMSFYIGPWSDRNGRRPLLLIPVLGFLLMYAVYLLLSLGFAKDFDTYYLLLASTPVALSGNLLLLLTFFEVFFTEKLNLQVALWRL
jgi:hypothetical protein